MSFSPELFFTRDGNLLKTMPMKGTRKRGLHPREEKKIIAELKNSVKEKAENLMVTDLLRNDLGKISEWGSVKVDQIFEVETYSTLYQMISEVSSKLRIDVVTSATNGWKEIFHAIFPGGSITGAPKIRSMERILQLENHPRGIYTGTIGRIHPEGKSTFSIAIRTIVSNSNKLRINLGSGIVWDSVAEKEYEECLLKMKFAEPEIQKETFLFETIRVRNGKPFLLDTHFERLEASAIRLDFLFLKNSAHQAIYSFLENYPKGDYRLKLELARNGQIALSIQDLKLGFENTNKRASQRPPKKLGISTKILQKKSLHLFHKTNRREIYSEELTKANEMGLDDFLFFNEDGELTESCIANVFIWNKENKKYYTPPIESGLLDGVFRRLVLRKFPKVFEEKVLHKSDLLKADKIFLCNSVRGWMPARLEL